VNLVNFSSKGRREHVHVAETLLVLLENEQKGLFSSFLPLRAYPLGKFTTFTKFTYRRTP